MISAKIQTTSKAGYPICKLGILTVYGNDNEINLVSPKLVTEVLGIQIQPWVGTISTSQINGSTTEIQGYVNLYWAPDSSSCFNWTQFMVTKHPNPPFDLILGCKDASNCGLPMP